MILPEGRRLSDDASAQRRRPRPGEEGRRLSAGNESFRSNTEERRGCCLKTRQSLEARRVQQLRLQVRRRVGCLSETRRLVFVAAAEVPSCQSCSPFKRSDVCLVSSCKQTARRQDRGTSIISTRGRVGNVRLPVRGEKTN